MREIRERPHRRHIGRCCIRSRCGCKARDRACDARRRDAGSTGLPPATVILAQIDPLRSEGQQYADKLRAAGIDVDVKQFDGVTHEFFGMAAVHPKAKAAQAEATARLRAAFGK